MKKETKKTKEQNTKKWILPVIILCVAVLVLVLILKSVGTAEVDQPSLAETTGENGGNSEQTASPDVLPEFVTIEALYGPMQFPGAYSENLEHLEVIEDDITMEVFYMLFGNTKVELFRIYFGDPTTGNKIGLLKTDKGEIPITISVPQYDTDFWTNEEAETLYFSMMDGMNILLNSIRSDSRFAEESIPEIQVTDTKLTYWTFPISEGMEYEEIIEGDSYKAVFYGNIGAERIRLYTVYLGDSAAEGILGTYTVDGVAKPVSIKTDDMSRIEELPEADREIAYRMMGTINDVFQTIVNSENFTELKEES